VNAARYRTSNREDDISWVGPPVRSLFKTHKIPIELKKNVVIGHAILSNPFVVPLAAALKAKKPMELMINQYQYDIPAEAIEVKYYSYDLLKDEIGPERTLDDGSVVINGNETVLAKFILAKDMPLKGFENIDSRFWQYFSLKVGFTKIGNDRPMVDGLLLNTREPNLGILSNESPVPWGYRHIERSRSAPRIAM